MVIEISCNYYDILYTDYTVLYSRKIFIKKIIIMTSSTLTIQYSRKIFIKKIISAP